MVCRTINSDSELQGKIKSKKLLTDSAIQYSRLENLYVFSRIERSLKVDTNPSHCH